MGHPEVKWSIVSSCCLHNRHLLSISFFKIYYYYYCYYYYYFCYLHGT